MLSEPAGAAFRCSAEGGDVSALEDFLGAAVFGSSDHRTPKLLGGEDRVGKSGTQQRHQRAGSGVEDTIPGGSGTDSVYRLDKTGPKHGGRLERQAQESVFGAAFHSCPGAAPVFGAISSGAGSVNEGYPRVEADPA